MLGTTLAGVIALLVAFLTALKLLSENFEKILGVYGRWQDKRKRASYILIPSAEELARYSIKEPDRHYPLPEDIDADARARHISREGRLANARMISLMVVFSILFGIIGSRLIYVGIIGSLTE